MSVTMDHLTEGEVIRVADAQLEMDETSRVNEHLASCTECRAHVARANVRRQRLASLLSATDFATPQMAVPGPNASIIDLSRARKERPRPTAWSMQPRMRAAAAVVLLLLGTLAIEPVRAAVTGWLRSQWNRISPSEQVVSPQETLPQTAPLPLGPRIEFEHEGPELRLEFVSVAPGSLLALGMNDGQDVVAESSTAGADLLVLPEGLRITGDRTIAGTYTVTVPASMATVIVSSGGRVIARATTDELKAGIKIELH